MSRRFMTHIGEIGAFPADDKENRNMRFYNLYGNQINKEGHGYAVIIPDDALFEGR